MPTIGEVTSSRLRREADSGSTGISPDLGVQPTGGLPRWLLLLIGGATATIAIAGLREVAWLVAPVFLALVVVVALTPVERWLRGKGAPRWLATTVLLLLV